MNFDMNFNLHIRFYTSCGGRQNMWIEKQGCDGMRYEVNNIDDAKNSFEQYITQVVNKDTHRFDMRC
ncbi:hypothetical protein C823_007821 [Eubacterium plexicaudatum ASF492]|uniref:Uncharacterized protein n=1 Tax=Eubacterium plexicaudatum ASF492 TaxID=1235802 RepID=N2AA09_9FIRM|nr:hypothetical protein C823_007821 [Eubacterium plexicaudatum ASF492]